MTTAGPPVAGDPAAQNERTALGWLRTSLGQLVVVALMTRLAIRDGHPASFMIVGVGLVAASAVGGYTLCRYLAINAWRGSGASVTAHTVRAMTATAILLGGLALILIWRSR